MNQGRDWGWSLKMAVQVEDCAAAVVWLWSWS